MRVGSSWGLESNCPQGFFLSKRAFGIGYPDMIDRLMILIVDVSNTVNINKSHLFYSYFDRKKIRGRCRLTPVTRRSDLRSSIQFIFRNLLKHRHLVEL